MGVGGVFWFVAAVARRPQPVFGIFGRRGGKEGLVGRICIFQNRASPLPPYPGKGMYFGRIWGEILSLAKGGGGIRCACSALFCKKSDRMSCRKSKIWIGGATPKKRPPYPLDPRFCAGFESLMRLDTYPLLHDRKLKK